MVDLKVQNKAMIGKLLQNIQAKEDKLWGRHHEMESEREQILDLEENNEYKNSSQITSYWEDATKEEKYKTRFMYKTLIEDKENVKWRKLLFANYVRPRS